MTFLRLVESENVIDRSKLRDNVHSQLLVNLLVRRYDNNLNASPLHVRFGSFLVLRQANVSVRDKLEQKVHLLPWLQDYVTVSRDKIPLRRSFNFALHDPMRQLCLVSNEFEF